jgi:hypothetical protein
MAAQLLSVIVFLFATLMKSVGGSGRGKFISVSVHIFQIDMRN